MDYKSGKQNVVADTLSHRDTETASLHALSTPTFTIFEDLCKEDVGPSDLATSIAQIEARQLSAPWSVADGLVMYDHKVYLPLL